MDNDIEEFYKKNYDHMKDIEDFGDTTFIKTNFMEPMCEVLNARYVNNIKEIPNLQGIINTILANHDFNLQRLVSEPVNGVVYAPNHDFLSDNDKDIIIKSINETIFNKIQFMCYRQKSLTDIDSMLYASMKSIDVIISKLSNDDIHTIRDNIKRGNLLLHGKVFSNPDFIPQRYPLEINYCGNTYTWERRFHL